MTDRVRARPGVGADERQLMLDPVDQRRLADPVPHGAANHRPQGGLDLLPQQLGVAATAGLEAAGHLEERAVVVSVHGRLLWLRCRSGESESTGCWTACPRRR